MSQSVSASKTTAKSLFISFIIKNLFHFIFFLLFSGLIYNENYDDILYVIQNGSLLRIDKNFESFDIYEHYCLEMDDIEGVLTAIVCEFDDMLFKVNRAQAMVFATCMIISVPVRINCC